MKALQLGINYGMGVRSLSRGLDRHPLIGSEVIIRHQRTISEVLGVARGMVERAMLERVNRDPNSTAGRCTSARRRTNAHSTIFRCRPAVLRCCGWRLTGCARPVSCRACWSTTASCSNCDNEEQVRHAIEIMRAAGAEVCGGLEIGVDIDQRLEGGARYRDKRAVAQKMWATVMGVLQELGAIPEVVAR